MPSLPATSYTTRPSTVQQSTRETIAWSVDTTALGTPAGPTTQLYDLDAGAVVNLADPPSINGNLVVQIVRGSALTPGHTYRLSVTAVIGGNTLDNEVTLQCPD